MITRVAFGTPWNLTNTQLSVSTAYSPQTDGAVERVNRVFEGMLRSGVNYKTMDWLEYLTACEYAYNDAVNETIGFSLSSSIQEEILRVHHVC